MYSFKPKEGDKKAVAKGVSNRITKREIRHIYYRECLMESKEMFHSNMKIEHTNHQLETKNSIKKSLSPFNDKKWIEKHGDIFIAYSFGQKNIKVGYLIKKIVIIIMLI